MSALALIARRRGVAVTGCDSHPSGASELVSTGAKIAAGHDPAHVDGARAVVYTAAVPAEHAELEAARRAGIRVVRRADALREVVAGGTVVAVAGTHGKTTTTAMVTEALAAAGKDPTGIAGGRIAKWGGNARLGGPELFVVEADEYDRSFLALDPTFAIVNNVEADHLECYGSLEALEDAFGEFAARASRVLYGADDSGARRVGEGLGDAAWGVGFGAAADVRIGGVRAGRARTRAAVTLPDGSRVELELTVPGLHNVRNAAMAVATVFALGEDAASAARGLATFDGVGRRFEMVGRARGVTVIDDYAHHPTEIAVTIGAARQRYPGARLVAVFQPHLYSRTQLLGSQLGIVLAAADHVVVTDVFGAREQPIRGVNGKVVARAAERAGGAVDWVPDRDKLAARLAELVREGDVVITLGAGDITTVGRELLSRLEGKAA
jgi:UDP-N-acetylmuramate--alanine ligase